MARLMHIDFYFDFISPYSYLAATQVPAFIQQHQIPINWVPINLVRLLRQADNRPPALIPKKARYLLRDLKRWALRLQVPFVLQKPGSFDSRPALAIAAGLPGPERASFCRDVFHAIWSGSIRPQEAGWLDGLFAEHDWPAAWRKFEPQQQRVDNHTLEAYRVGAFGVPSFVLHGARRRHLFWGIDRMDFLADAVLREQQDQHARA